MFIVYGYIYEIHLYFDIMANEHNQQFSPKRQFTIRHQEKEYNGYSGQCLAIPGAISQGIL